MFGQDKKRFIHPVPRAVYSGCMEMFKTDGPSKDHATRHVLMAEAERRVRAGELRADVARDLQIPASTIAIWAARGRWRKTDLKREAAGLPPLPLPFYARDDRNISAGSGTAGRQGRGEQGTGGAQGGVDKPPDLQAQARALGRAARAAFERGDLKTAEAKLGKARRLLRLDASLAALAPAMTPVQKERTRILALSEDELRDEIRHLVGLA